MSQAETMSPMELEDELKEWSEKIIRFQTLFGAALTSKERNLLAIIEDIFSSYDNDPWYELYEMGGLDFTTLTSAFRQSIGTKNQHTERSVQFVRLIISLLSLSLYRLKLYFNNERYSVISPEIINYVPEMYNTNPELYQPLYNEWLNIPINAAIKRADETLTQIESSRTIVSGLSDFVEEQDKEIRAEFEQERQKLIEEVSLQNHYFKQIITASLSELSDSFANFKTRKKQEIRYSLTACGSLAAFAIGLVFYTYFSNYWTFNIDLSSALTLLKAALPDSQALQDVTLATNTNTNTNHLLSITKKSIPIVTIEVLLIYFFRIALNNYYAARDELLQLEIREALCLFAPKYKAFVGNSDSTINNPPRHTPDVSQHKTSTNGTLDEFAKHIFSPLNSRLNPTPHPLDFLGQVTEAVKKVKR